MTAVDDMLFSPVRVRVRAWVRVGVRVRVRVSSPWRVSSPEKTAACSEVWGRLMGDLGEV